MNEVNRVLMIGATGMLGRPVARRLVGEGFAVRALVRAVERGRRLLPGRCELMRGDLRDDASLRAALAGMDAVYLNLSEPMRRKPPKWSPEIDGTRAAIDAAKACGVRRIVRISAMGVDAAAADWWAAKHKLSADELVMNSGLDWTIFRPTWLMESIATFKVAGPIMMSINLPDAPLRWIAGDDHARQAAAALRSPASINRLYLPQGPELLTIPQAVRRFARAWPRRMIVINLPMGTFRPAALMSGKAHYLVSLLDMTRNHSSHIDRQPIPTDLPPAAMTLEDYARYVERTSDWPRK